MKTRDDLLLEYDSSKQLHESFCLRVKILIEQLLEKNHIHVNSTTHRTKSRDSFARKISKAEATYKTISEVTDVAGVRVITYFADHVDQVASLIETEFDIDKRHSVDKRAALEPDRFGYLSLHYIARLSTSRTTLPEYSQFSGLNIEIQVRSILQHAWAEIEHDLGYKSQAEIPKTIRRQFSRLAGLLEIADNEFIKIKLDLANYSQEVSKQIGNNPAQVAIDSVSLYSFVTTDKLVRELDRHIAKNLNSKLVASKDDMRQDIKRLKHFDITTLGKLQNILKNHRPRVIALSDMWKTTEKPRKETDEHSTLSAGISIFYLCHVLACDGANKKKIEQYLSKFQIGSLDSNRDLVSEYISFGKRWM